MLYRPDSSKMWLPKKPSAIAAVEDGHRSAKGDMSKMSTTQVPAIDMKVRQFAMQFQYFMISLVLISIWSLRAALAQDDHSQTLTPQHQELTPDQKSKASALVKIVWESIERFKDVSVAETEGYVLQFGCVSGPDAGARTGTW
jgi:hypothetical protein